MVTPTLRIASGIIFGAEHRNPALVCDNSQRPRCHYGSRPTREKFMAADIGRLRSWLQAVADVAAAANTAIEIRELLDIVAGNVTRLTDFEFCAVVLSEEADDTLKIVGASGLASDYISHVNEDLSIHKTDGHPMSSGPTTRAFRSARPVVVQDVSSDETFMPWREAAEKQGYRSLLCVPLISDHHVVGVLNAYGLHPRAIPPEEIGLVETLANHAAIALTTARLRDSEHRALTAVQNHSDALERAQLLHQRLLDVIMADDPLPILVQTVHEVMGCSIRLLLHDRVDLIAGHTFDADQSLKADVVFFDDVVGRIEADASSDDVAQRMLDSAALVVSLVVLHERHAEEVETRQAADVVQVLSSGAETDTAALRRRVQRLGHDLDLPHVVAVLRVVDQTGEHTSDRSSRALLHAAYSSVPRSAPQPLVVAAGADVVVALPLKETSIETLYASIRRCYADVQHRLHQREVHCAIGRTIENLLEVGPAIRAATAVLDLRIAGRGIAEVTVLPKSGALMALLQSSYPADLVDFATTTLGPLFDSPRGGELAETLGAYLASDGSLSQAAKLVHVHPNTVSYRLGRVENLTGLDLRRSETRLDLQLALLISHVLGRTARDGT